MKSRSSARGEPRRFGNVALLALMLCSLVALSLIRARFSPIGNTAVAETIKVEDPKPVVVSKPAATAEADEAAAVAGKLTYPPSYTACLSSRKISEWIGSRSLYAAGGWVSRSAWHFFTGRFLLVISFAEIQPQIRQGEERRGEAMEPSTDLAAARPKLSLLYTEDFCSK
ncbi:hypothetical protein VPH35_122683 [Triticum aestivum]